MKIVPNTETIRHLCHFHGGSQYYLLAGTKNRKPILVTNVQDKALLAKELQSWCGMVIDIFDTKDQTPDALEALKQGTALHLAAENISLTEE